MANAIHPRNIGGENTEIQLRISREPKIDADFLGAAAYFTRVRSMNHRTFSAALASHLILAATLRGATVQPGADEAEEIVVTATGSREIRETIPQTIRSYTAEEITESAPRQLTDFFRSNALGQLQEYSPGHSTIELRGATNAIAGQGWTDTSEIAVLINGRPAGTANLGKISLNDIEDIEILRGPNSVLYGSSAVGGVINLITRDGESFKGTELTTLFSSFDRYSQIVQTGNKIGALDYYLELSATASGNYKTGIGSSGEQPNTDFNQRGTTVSLGYDLTDRQRLEFTFRQDGIYHAGHPGATYSTSDFDDRYNTSAELRYSGSTSDGQFTWSDQIFYVRDVDALHWSQDPLIGLIPEIAAPGLIGSPGILSDVNRRELQEWGNRFSSQLKLQKNNTLTLGADFKYSTLDSSRERSAAPGYLGGLIGLPVVLPPLSVDSRTVTNGVFVQDSQRFLDDKINVRLGGRYDHIDQTALPTENATITRSSRDEDIFVYQGGVTYQPFSWLGFRANAGTGYLSAGTTQLFGTVRQVNGFNTLPNADLKDEKTFGWDLGGRLSKNGFNLDVSFFENKIEDYLTAELIPGTANLQWRNADERKVRGIEIQTSYDLATTLGCNGWSLEPYLSGNYYFKKNATDLAGNSADQQYLSDYHLNAGVRGGQPGKWTANLYVSLAGPSEVNAGYLQNANVGLANLTSNNDIPGYAILNFNGSIQLTPSTNFFYGVNNLLDKNYSSYFYAINNRRTDDVAPYLRPGTVSAEGMSSPGREFFGGISFTF